MTGPQEKVAQCTLERCSFQANPARGAATFEGKGRRPQLLLQGASLKWAQERDMH